MKFRAIALGLAFVLVQFALVAEAAAPEPWAKPAFQAAQKAGEPIVVFVHASW